jgi:hypothetical protein
MKVVKKPPITEQEFRRRRYPDNKCPLYPNIPGTLNWRCAVFMSSKRERKTVWGISEGDFVTVAIVDVALREISTRLTT